MNPSNKNNLPKELLTKERNSFEKVTLEKGKDTIKNKGALLYFRESDYNSKP